MSRRRSRSRARRACRCCRAAAAPRNAARPSARALVIDCSKHMDRRVVALDVEARRVAGAARASCSSGSTARCASTSCSSRSMSRPASRATIGGMTANNSCGARSIRYGNMVHNVRGDRRAARRRHRGAVRRGPGNFGRGASRPSAIASSCATCARCTGARPTRSSARFPKLLRRVGGYNIDMIDDSRPQHGASAGRLRGHARLLQRDRARPAADPAAPGARHLPFPELLQGDGRDPAHRQARARARSSWSTAR